ncbi:uncharacterized protein LOC144752268 isoform X2 [Lissotriton helveticus]
MAARFSALQNEVTCSICWEYFTNPVTIECGHNFCSVCIATFWKNASGGIRTCPQCRRECTKTDLCKNLQLTNLVVIAKQLSVNPGVPGEMCEWHEEKLKLFCEDDQQAVCTICDRSREHRGHIVIPIEEALQQYKLKIYNTLEILKRELAEISRLEALEKQSLSEFKATVERERQKIASEFEEMHNFLEEQMQLFLSQLQEEEKATVKKLEESIATLTRQNDSLTQLIAEKEEMCKQSSVHLLKDAKTFLNRAESEKPAAIFTELSNYACSVPRQHCVATKMVKRFGDSQHEDLRIVLIGETGVGKRVLECISSEGEVQKSAAGSRSMATVCEKKTCIRGGRTLTLVDAPGLLGGIGSREELAEEIGQCVVMSSPGPHAVLLVLSVGHFTKAQEEAVRIIQDLFGEETGKYTIVIFAREYGLKKDEMHGLIQESKGKIKEMIAKCGNRFCTFDTSATGERNDWQLSKLVTMIDKMVVESGGSCYSNTLWKEAEKELQKRVEDISKKYEEQHQREEAEVKSQHDKLFESLKKEPESLDKSKRLEELALEMKAKLEEIEKYNRMRLRGIRDEAEEEFLQSMRGKMEVGGPLGMVIGAAMGKVVGGPLGMFVGGPVGILVGGALGGAVGGTVGGAMGDAVGATVKMFKGLLDM